MIPAITALGSEAGQALPICGEDVGIVDSVRSIVGLAGTEALTKGLKEEFVTNNTSVKAKDCS